MGRIPASEGQKRDTIVFASETCAFDLIGATYERDVKPGELVSSVPKESPHAFIRRPRPAIELHFRACLFLAPRQYRVWTTRCRPAAKNLGRQLAREAPVEADLVVPVPDSGVTAAVGYAAESGIPFRFRPDPQSLRGTHFHRAAAKVCAISA